MRVIANRHHGFGQLFQYWRKLARRQDRASMKAMKNNPGYQFRLARQLRGLSQSKLAAMAGVHPAEISHIECGRRLPSLATIIKLSDALAVNIDYLIGRKCIIVPAGPKVTTLLYEYFGAMTAEDQGTLFAIAEAMVKRRKLAQKN